MVNVHIEGEEAIFEVEAHHKIWALKSRLEIPLAHITNVHADPNPAMGWFDGLKLMGADLPHHFRAGNFWLHGHIVFYDVVNPQNTIVVELAQEHFFQLIIEVVDPQATVRMLQEKLKGRSASA